jgi:hypothetical protein
VLLALEADEERQEQHEDDLHAFGREQAGQVLDHGVEVYAPQPGIASPAVARAGLARMTPGRPPVGPFLPDVTEAHVDSARRRI